nr:hypothetical protein Iba_chr14bCG9300 [Ipomoea batatas]
MLSDRLLPLMSYVSHHRREATTGVLKASSLPFSPELHELKRWPLPSRLLLAGKTEKTGGGGNRGDDAAASPGKHRLPPSAESSRRCRRIRGGHVAAAASLHKKESDAGVPLPPVAFVGVGCCRDDGAERTAGAPSPPSENSPKNDLRFSPLLCLFACRNGKEWEQLE